MKIQATRLSNGLRLVTAPVKGTSFIHLALAVRVGSRYEPTIQNGMSHFLEHMIFRGSENYPSSYLLNYSLETLGDGLQGGTTREYTLYSIEIPPENLQKTLSVLSDLFQRPLFSDVEIEKEIIFEEMLDDLDENGQDSDLEMISRKLLFGGHPLGQPVIGKRTTLTSVTREDLQLYFKEFYQPDNMVIAATGDVEFGKFFKAVNQSLGPLEAQLNEEPVILLENEQDEESPASMKKFSSIQPVATEALPSGEEGPNLLFQKNSSTQVEFLLSFVAEGERSPDFIKQMALERVLDDGLSSRLQRRLCERKGILYDISVSTDNYTDIGIMDFSFQVKPEKAVLALREVLNELRALKETLIDDQELGKVKLRLEREARAFFEDARHMAPRIAEAILLGYKTPLYFEDWKKGIESLKVADIQEMAARIFQSRRLVMVVEGLVSELEQAEMTLLISILK